MKVFWYPISPCDGNIGTIPPTSMAVNFLACYFPHVHTRAQPGYINIIFIAFHASAASSIQSSLLPSI